MNGISAYGWRIGFGREGRGGLRKGKSAEILKFVSWVKYNRYMAIRKPIHFSNIEKNNK